MIPTDEPHLRHAPATVHGRYLVLPARGDTRHWLIGFHGQAQTAEIFLESLARVPRGAGWLVASVQGLNRYYAGRTQQIVAHWMTRQDREYAITDNVAYVDTVCDQLELEFGPPRAIVFAGFSQGVAMAYRAGLLGRHQCAAVVAACGDVPPELVEIENRAWPRVLAVTGSGDEWYTRARLEQDLALLRSRRVDVRSQVFTGGHEWSDEVARAVGGLLTEVESATGG